MSNSKNPFEEPKNPFEEPKNPFEEPKDPFEDSLSDEISHDSTASTAPTNFPRSNNQTKTGDRETQKSPNEFPSPRPASRSSTSSMRDIVSNYRSSIKDQDLHPDGLKRSFSIFDATVNLPAVLNDPRKPRPAEFLTRTWGDSFVETAVRPSPLLADFSIDNFRSYLRCINIREAIKKGTKSSSDGSGRGSARGHRHSCPDELAEIPPVFFSQSFNLQTAGIFRQVFPPEWQTQAGLRTGQNKLGHYLDTVESEIARHVSIRAEAFFGVVTSHDLLQEKMDISLNKVVSLRSSLKIIQDVSVKPALKTIGTVHKRYHLSCILERLQTMATISQTQLTIQMLLSNGDFVGALDLITTTRDVVACELFGLTCFRHLSHQLTEMEKFIDKMMSMEFRRALSAHLNRSSEGVASTTMLEEERFCAIVTGLLRQRRFNVLDWFREEALSALQATLKFVLIRVLTDHQSADLEADDPTLPYHLLKSLQFEGLVLFFRELRAPLREILARIRSAHDVTSGLHVGLLAGQESRAGAGADSEGTGLTPTDLSRLTTQLQELLFAVAEETQEEMAKILNRSPGWRDLKNVDVVSLWDILQVIMKDGEEILAVRMTVLNAQLQKLAFAHAARFHEDRKQKLTLILDSERWTSAEIPVEFQSFVDRIFAQQTFLVALPRQKYDESVNAEAGDTSPSISSPKAIVPSLMLNGEHYLVVGTVVLLLRMLGEYVALTDKLPASMNISGDILQKVVELLKMFNSRTCQLVLGAGAMLSAGLKSITSKNLILSSRCLQMVALVIPVVQNDLVKKLATKQLHLANNFDSLLRDYNIHIEEIEKKLVQIFDSQLITQFSRWEAVVPVPSQSFRMIFTSVKRLHDAVSEMLPQAHLERLFHSLFLLFKRRLKQQISKLGIANDGGPQHGIVTAELSFFRSELQSLTKLRTFDDNFFNIWS